MTDLEIGAEAEPTEAAPVLPASTAPVSTAAGAADWTAALPEDARGFVKNKGWAKPADLLDSYRHLERLVGAERIALPRDENDRANWERVWNRLGRPEKPEGYKLPLPEKGGDKALAKAFAERAHALGLTTKQARGLTDWWNTTATDGLGRAERQKHARETAEIETLQAELGAAFEGEAAAARRAAHVFGFDTETLTRIEGAIGTAAMLRRFMAIGRALGEDRFEGGSDGGFGPSVEGARARIDSLKADPVWTKRYLGGDEAAKAELQRLMRAAYPEG
ncbi:MAG: hypothetical protein ACM3N5_09150 [Candidatus Eiseniibacteriota bacterium]